jgi:hypothetical protein
MAHWIPVRVLARLGGFAMMRFSGVYKVVDIKRKLMMRNDVVHTSRVVATSREDVEDIE